MTPQREIDIKEARKCLVSWESELVATSKGKRISEETRARAYLEVCREVFKVQSALYSISGMITDYEEAVRKLNVERDDVSLLLRRMKEAADEYLRGGLKI